MSNVTIKGMDNLFFKLDNITNRQTLNKGITKACLMVEAQAKRNVGNSPKEWKEDDPAEIAMVKAMITHAILNTSSGCVGRVGINSLFAIWLHQGTGLYAVNGDGRKDVPWFWRDPRTGETKSSSGRKPTQFLNKALNSKKEKIKEILFETYEESVK